MPTKAQLQEQIKALNTEVSSLSNQAKKSVKEINTLKRDLNSEENKLKVCVKQLKSANEDNCKLEADVEDYMAKIHKLRETTKRTQSTIDTVRRENEAQAKTIRTGILDIEALKETRTELKADNKRFRHNIKVYADLPWNKRMHSSSTVYDMLFKPAK